MSILPANSEQIFAMALALPFEEREQAIETACGSDHATADQVRNLLRCHDRNESDGFVLDTPVVGNIDPSDCVADVAVKIGDRIGRYKLLERIGEGGMGVVFMAEQAEDVRRQVALKIVKLGMDTRQVIARFEAERQAMALFDHPNIARVLDAGSTSTGRPYFVMELVRGSNISKYLKNHEVNLAERLRLFVDICTAVQHAHQKGIIHRDLKPSNILVTLSDGVATPKVIDFGIAKAIGRQLTERTLFTGYASLVGTPQYMSPEQAELNGADVDTRSDIYSLGVLLYEFATGTTPHSRDELRNAGPVGLFETLRGAEFESPSQRLKRVISTSHSDQGRSFKQELDWIAMKALERNPSDRYASANELAADVSRYLRNERVLAAPPSWVYQIRRAIDRHLAAVVGALSVVALLVVASVTCILFGVETNRVNEELSEANTLLAEKVDELEKAEATIRASALGQQYDSAIAIALIKFEADFDSHVFGIAERLYPDGLSEYHICCEYDRDLLAEVPFQSLFELPLSHVRRHIKQDKEFYERLDAAFASEENEESVADSEEADHEHSKECMLVTEQANRELAQFRHVFYRNLVNEYRRAFGENHANVAASLNLLAACLIERGEIRDAELRLKEALKIGGERDVQTAEMLLEEIHQSRDSAG